MSEKKDKNKTAPDHGHNTVGWSGAVLAEARKPVSGEQVDVDADQEADAESILLLRLRQVMGSLDLIGSQKLILAAILSELKDQEECTLTYEEIASSASLSRRVVAKYVPILEDEGWIKRRRESNSYKYKYTK